VKQIAVIAVLAAATSARADSPVASSERARLHPPAEPEPAPAPQAPQPDARTAKQAPPPGYESGRVDAGGPGESTGRTIARGALYLPKVLFEVAMWPFGQAIYLEDRYQLSDWYYRIFYYEDRTIAIIPTATWVTGFGLQIGARFFDTNTFGDRERLVLQATGGLDNRVGLLGSIDTGHRLGPVRLELGGNYDRRPSEPFFGIGNEAGSTETPPPVPIDAQTDSTAFKTHFRYQEARAVLLADIDLWRNLYLDGRGYYGELKYTHSDVGLSIENAYQQMSLVGFDQTTRYLYGEGGLRWDTRRRVSIWEPYTVHAEGSLVLGYAGYVDQLDHGGRFWHYGTELQHYFRFGFGPRVVALRFHGEGVTGDLNEVPITQLPMLGGGEFLRGYDYARFRDRLAAVGSLQYMWPLFAYASGYVFTDVGRVYRSWSDLTLSNMRAGFGVGLEFYGARSFWADVAVGTSIDGGVVLTAEFSPVLDARTRWR
jgi:hypothetical protein